VILNFFKIFGPEVGVVNPWGTSGFLPDHPLKYGADTTSRSEVIEFTINDFFGEKWGNSPPLSPPLVVLVIAKERDSYS